MSATDRVVEVFTPAGADDLGNKGAGYLLGDGLVLTARHVIEEATRPCQVRALGHGRWVATTVLWRGGVDHDGALLRVNAPWSDIECMRLGRLVGDDRAVCDATGFPWAQLERRDDVPVRRTEHLIGEIDRLSGQTAGVAPGLLTIHITGSVPEPRDDGGSPWEGMSGAGLVCGELLVGVVIVDPARFGPDRLLAVPLTRLAAAPGFVDALAAVREVPVMLEAVEAQGVLERAYEAAPPPRARQTSSYLLGARYGVVPFRPRVELDELRGWVRGGNDIEVAVLTGVGGIGKSRLARELCAGQALEDWVAGLLTHEPRSEPLSRLTRVDAPVLVIIDYAETRAHDVVAVLAGLTRSATARRPRRLLLIARQLGDWWTQLLHVRCADGEVGELLRCAPAIELGAADDDVLAREAAYRAAMAAFAEQVGAPATDPPLPDLSDRLFETLLMVHMAALGVLPGAGDTPLPRSASIRADLLARALEREERYWRDSAKALDPALDVDEHVRRRAVAVATLATPTTTATPTNEAQAAALLEVVPDLDSVAARRRVARWLHDLYQSSGGWIAPLEPDLLGEALIAQTVMTVPELARDLLGRADQPTAARALTVLTRGSRHHDSCRTALREALDHHLHHLAGTAVDVAQQLGDPIGVLLADALDHHADSALSRDVLRRVPQETVSLRETAAVAATHALQNMPDGSPERGELLIEQSNRFRALGRHEDALAAIEDALVIHRQLDDAHPDAALPNLATSLNSQSQCLSELGRREDALTAIEDAVAIYWRLANERPDAFLPNLTNSLFIKSCCLQELGRGEDALTAHQKCVAISRRLPNARTDASLPNLTSLLKDQSNRLTKQGPDEDPLGPVNAPVALFRRLADERPDEFQPALGESLSNQSHFLSERGRAEDALAAIEEAVAIFRQLTDKRPDAFLPGLAKSLDRQSSYLSDVGRQEDALAAIEEAVAIFRRLADERPDAFLPRLAESLSNQSNRLSALGRHEQALTAIEEAVQRVLPVLERAHYLLPDAGLRLLRNYLARCNEAQCTPDAEAVGRLQAVLSRLY